MSARIAPDIQFKFAGRDLKSSAAIQVCGPGLEES